MRFRWGQSPAEYPSLGAISVDRRVAIPAVPAGATGLRTIQERHRYRRSARGLSSPPNYQNAPGNGLTGGFFAAGLATFLGCTFFAAFTGFFLIAIWLGFFCDKHC